MVSGFGFADPSHTVTVEIRAGRPVASDGPYAEAKEVLAGFGIVDVEAVPPTFSGRFMTAYIG